MADTQNDTSESWPAVKKIVGIGVAVVIGIWLVVLAVALLADREGTGQLGDAFGTANALFSGFAFVAVIAALRLQALEFKNQLDEFQESTDVQRKINMAAQEELKLQRAFAEDAKAEKRRDEALRLYRRWTEELVVERTKFWERTYQFEEHNLASLNPEDDKKATNQLRIMTSNWVIAPLSHVCRSTVERDLPASYVTDFFEYWSRLDEAGAVDSELLRRLLSSEEVDHLRCFMVRPWRLFESLSADGKPDSAKTMRKWEQTILRPFDD